MFSMKQKQEIAAKVEKVLLDFEHPEMPKKKVNFILDIRGKEGWSYANILPNWMFGEGNPPGINPHNEAVAKIMKGENGK